MRIIDTHCHLIYRNRLRYPWLASVPALNRDYTLDDYLPQAQSAGITDILHMEVDVADDDMEAETDLITSLSTRVIGAVAACRPESPQFPAYLDSVAANPKVRGLRRVLHVQPDGLSQTQIFAGNLRRLTEHALPFALCVLAHQLPIATDLVRACDRVQFVLDHCGNPPIKDGDLGSWRTYLCGLAALPNVACKLSGIVTNAD